MVEVLTICMYLCTKETIRTTKIKAYMHCHKCEHDLRAKLLKHKGKLSTTHYNEIEFIDAKINKRPDRMYIGPNQKVFYLKALQKV